MTEFVHTPLERFLLFFFLLFAHLDSKRDWRTATDDLSPRCGLIKVLLAFSIFWQIETLYGIEYKYDYLCWCKKPFAYIYFPCCSAPLRSILFYVSHYSTIQILSPGSFSIEYHWCIFPVSFFIQQLTIINNVARSSQKKSKPN